MCTIARTGLWFCIAAMFILAIWYCEWTPLNAAWLKRAVFAFGIMFTGELLAAKPKPRHDCPGSWMTTVITWFLIVCAGLLFLAESASRRGYALTIPFLGLGLCAWRVDWLWFGHDARPIEAPKTGTFIWEIRQQEAAAEEDRRQAEVKHLRELLAFLPAERTPRIDADPVWDVPLDESRVTT